MPTERAQEGLVSTPPSPGTASLQARLGVAAAAALGLCLAPLGGGGSVVVGVVTVAALLLLSAIDVRTQTLPNRIVLPATAFVLTGHLATRPDRAGEWLLAAVATSAALLLLALISRGGLGMGDVKLGLLIGAAAGKGALLAVTVAFLTAPLLAVALLLVHGRSARFMTMPFGPFLAVGTIVAIAVAAPWHAVLA